MYRRPIFSLSAKTSEALPDKYNGVLIRTEFRQILRIFRMLHDPEIADGDRMRLMLGMFYAGTPPHDAAEGFAWFVACGRQSTGDVGGTRDFDYEQDAPEIYAAFWQLYGIDLFRADLHWWQFSALMDGVFATENALSNKVKLRHASDTDAQRKAALDRAKRAAAIKDAHSLSDMSMQEQLQDALRNGGDVNAILEQMR